MINLGIKSTRAGQILWMILAMSLAATASVFAKVLTTDMHVIQILWLRLVLGSVMMFPLFWIRSGRGLPGLGRMHLMRAVILIGMTGLWFFALKLGPIAQAAALSYTYPIFILVFAAVFFGERIRGIDVASILLSFVGVAIVFRNGWSGGELNPQDILQMVVVLGSSILIAIRVSVEKVMTVDVDPEDILLGSMIIATIIVLPLVVPVWTAPGWREITFLCGLAITATLAQLFVIRLVQSHAWSIVSIFAFWEVLAAIGLGMIIFGESLSTIALFGAGLIVVGGMLQFRRK